MTPEQRQHIQAHLDEGSIRGLVETFYDRVRQDPLLAPVFEAQIRPEDWPHHLDRMTDFWGTALLASGRYRGNPMTRHAVLPEIDSQHFDRWLELFEATVEELFEPSVAEGILSLATGMRRGLQHAVDRYRDAASPILLARSP